MLKRVNFVEFLKRNDPKNHLESFAKRRKLLLDEMDQSREKKISCIGCSAPCCTFLKNSMQISPLEAMDIYLDLNRKGLWTRGLELRLEETIKTFRLNILIPTARTGFLRRNYTCPFFSNTELGCQLDPIVKPYGCLGFNPTVAGKIEGESCFSNVELMEKREQLDLEEKAISDRIRDLLKLSWKKETIPQALLDIHRNRQVLCK